MRHLVLLSLCLLLAVSCAEPLSREQFVGGKGPYVFTVDMSDTTAAYDFDFYTRVDSREVPAFVELLIRWTSPTDSVLRETVFLPMEGRRIWFSTQVYQAYRADVRPATPGLWTLTVSAPSQPSGFRGMGLVTRKQKNLWATEN